MMPTRRTTLAALVAALVTANTALAGEIAHDLGTTDVPEAPERVVVLEFSFIDALVSVGMVPVGIADDNKAERVMEVYGDVLGEGWTSVGTRKTPSLEVIASLQPDLIIADTARHSDAYDTLSQIAPTIVLDSLGGNYHDSVAQMAVIGDAIGQPEAMEARIAAHKATMADYAARDRAHGHGRGGAVRGDKCQRAVSAFARLVQRVAARDVRVLFEHDTGRGRHL